MGSPQLGTPIAVASAISLGSPITILGHYDNSLGSSDAASQGVVYSKTIEDQPFLRPGEVLETVPGLVVTQHSGEGKANQYFLRGYNLDHGTTSPLQLMAFRPICPHMHMGKDILI